MTSTSNTDSTTQIMENIIEAVPTELIINELTEERFVRKTNFGKQEGISECQPERIRRKQGQIVPQSGKLKPTKSSTKRK